MSNKKTPYETIGNELDNRIKKRNEIIAWIKWELFDVLTLWDDEKSRKDVGEKIIKELDKKLAVAKNEKYIENLKHLQEDVQNRIDTWNQTKIEKWKSKL